MVLLVVVIKYFVVICEVNYSVGDQVTATEHPRVDYDSAESLSSEDEDDEEDEEFAGTSRR